MTGLLRGKTRVLLLAALVIALVALVACKGDQGPQGPQGPQGEAGAPGAAGASGNPGDAGAPGNPGAAGAPGEPGAPGAIGATGPEGPAGPEGQKGTRGVTGAAGAAGAQGPAGAAGPPGVPGVDGGSAAAIIVHDTASNVAGAVELKAAGTEADILGAGFDSGETVSVSARVGGSVVVLGSGVANDSGAFWTTVTIPASMTAAGGPYTIDAIGDGGSLGYGVVLITDKVSD